VPEPDPIDTPPADLAAGDLTPPAPPAQEPPTKPETDWKAESRKHEARAKENDAKAKRLDEILESQKSDAEKLAARAEAAEKRASDLEQSALRDRIAREHDLPAELADRLRGATADELTEDAKTLQKIAKAAKPGGEVDQGVKGGGQSAPSQLSAADLQKMTPAQIVKAQADGRCNDLLGIKTP
jgi:hypothetical protein